MLTPSPVDWMVPASVNAPAPRIEILLEDWAVSMRGPLSLPTPGPPADRRGGAAGRAADRDVDAVGLVQVRRARDRDHLRGAHDQRVGRDGAADAEGGRVEHHR